MADSNRVKISMAKETTFGTAEAGGGNAYEEVRFISESLKQDLSLSQSEEIRAYRDIPALNLTDKAVSGSINQNLYYDEGVVDSLMEAALGASAFSNSGADQDVENGSATAATTQSSRTYTIDMSSAGHPPVVGEWLQISGFTADASNGYHQVATVSGTSSFTVNKAIGADQSGVSATIRTMPEITNGTTLTSFTIQRDYTSLTNQAEVFTGCVVDGFSVDCTGQDTAKMSFDFVGVDASSDTNGVESIDTTMSTNPAMSTINGVQFCAEGSGAGSVADFDCLGWSFNVSNGLRKRYTLGTLGPSSMALGDFTVTGTMQLYFATATLFDKFLDQTATALCFGISDESSGIQNGFVFDFPSVKFIDGQRVAGGRNQDIIADISWQALYNGSTHTMKIAHT